jgi:SsrA-binding protein
VANQTDKKGKTEPHSIQNRRARFDYNISESHEAGIVLVGSEVKSLFLGKAHLNDAFCRVHNGELFLINADIEPYEKSSVFQHERRRDRKLLMHRKEINTLDRKSMEKGLSLIPLALYFKNGKVKVNVGLGKGKALYDKRDKIAQDDERREVERIRANKFD